MHPRTLAVGLVALSLVGVALPAVSQPARPAVTATAIDGVYGPYTASRVAAFQRAQKLKADGLAGARTLAALGLPHARTLKPGLRGPDVLALQRALAARGFWRPAPRPTAAPSRAPRPTPTPTGTPSVWRTPAVLHTPRPAAARTPDAPEPSPAAPAAGPAAAAEAPPIALTVRAGTWFLPQTAGATDYGFDLASPTWTLDAAGWWGAWGLAGHMTVFEPLTVLQPSGPAPARYQLADVLAQRRFGPWRLAGGYRGVTLGTGPVGHFATAGLGGELPLADWLALTGRLQGGYDFAGGTYADGSAAIALRGGPLSAGLGFRHLAMSGGPGRAMLDLRTNGPTAELSIRF